MFRNNLLRNIHADVAELADAHDSKSCGKPCGFESHHRHQNKYKKDLVNVETSTPARFYFLETNAIRF